MNDNGTRFPIFGTCMGFELLAFITADRKLDMLSCSSQDQRLPLEFKQSNCFSSFLFLLNGNSSNCPFLRCVQITPAADCSGTPRRTFWTFWRAETSPRIIIVTVSQRKYVSVRSVDTGRFLVPNLVGNTRGMNFLRLLFPRKLNFSDRWVRVTKNPQNLWLVANILQPRMVGLFQRQKLFFIWN